MEILTRPMGEARAVGKANVIGPLDSGEEADLTIIDLETLLPCQRANALAELMPDVVALCIYPGSQQANLAGDVRERCICQTPNITTAP